MNEINGVELLNAKCYKVISSSEIENCRFSSKNLSFVTRKHLRKIGNFNIPFVFFSERDFMFAKALNSL